MSSHESTSETDLSSTETPECPDCLRQWTHLCRKDQDQENQDQDKTIVQSSTSSQAEQITLNLGDHENQENLNSENHNQNGGRSPTLENVSFTYQHIQDALDALPNEASPGPDGVPGCVLKKAKVPVSLMLYNIFNSSMDTGVLPEMLKLAFITPVHKGGSMGEPVNFRPISLTSHVGKTFERVLRVGIVNFLEINKLMDQNQHGSRANRSTLTQLIAHQDEILKLLEDGGNVDVIYLDFLKAFDKVDLGILLHKLKHLGIGGKLGRWLHSFLINRKQQVIVKGCKSEASVLISGVPQGSVLGPILFLIYLSDIGENIKADIKTYVDDSKVKQRINKEEDVENMQDDLEMLYDWGIKNNMKFNGTKFQLMRYGKNQLLKENTIYFTPNMEEPIESFSTLRDLGVMMSEDANFDDHIEHVCKKTRQKMGWLLRTFRCRNNDFMKHTFNSLVRPHIDYCSQLWMPNQCQQMEKVENLLKQFTAKIPWLREESYWQRLKILKMNSEERRMERYRIIYTWKVLEGLVPNCGIEKIQTGENSNRRCRIPSGKSKQRAQSFQVGGPKLFNSMPANIRDTSNCSLDDFKEKLDRYLTNIPDEPKIGGLTPAACDLISGQPSNSLPAQIARIRIQSRS